MHAFEREDSGAFTRVISNAMYSRQSIAAAQAAFKQYCRVSAKPQGQGYVQVSIEVIGDAKSSARQAVLEFWNFVLDSEAKRRLDAE
jgi:hypothetical protein